MKKKIIIFSVIISNLLTAILSFFIADRLYALKLISNAVERNIYEAKKTQILLDAIIEDLKKDSTNTVQKLELLKRSISESYEGFDLKKSLEESRLVQQQNVNERS
jgi:hypothetical protein